MINLIFALWLIWFTYKGARAGAYAMLFGLLAFVLAYGLCFVFTDDLAALIRQFGVNALYAVPIAAILLFGGCSLAVNVLSKLIFYLIPELKHRGLSLGGAALGCFLGAVSGILLVWASGFIRAALEWEHEPSLVENHANKWVGALADKGVELAGVEGVKAQAAKAMFKDPSGFTKSLKSLSESAELKNFVQSQEVQDLMMNNDIEGLQEHTDFKALLAQPGMASLVAGEQNSEREVASQLTDVLQRMHVLKDDPEVKVILADPEVKQLIAEGDALSLLANKKMQGLVNRVLDMDISEIDLSQWQTNRQENTASMHPDKSATNSDKSATNRSEPSSVIEQEIYQWYDAEGRLQFSDYQSIPVDRRESAIRMVK